MSKGETVSTNIRFNLSREADRAAWEHLQRRNRRQFHSYSRTVIAAVNDYFDRRDRLEEDPHLETREKEDAFLLRVLETVRAGCNHAVPSNTTDELLQLLRSSQTEVPPAGEDEREEQRETDNIALNFLECF